MEVPGGCSPRGCKELDMTERLHFTFHFHALEKEMATPSSALAWRIPRMGEPGGLPSMGSHKVGQNWHNLAAATAADWVGSEVKDDLVLHPKDALVASLWEKAQGPRLYIFSLHSFPSSFRFFPPKPSCHGEYRIYNLKTLNSSNTFKLKIWTSSPYLVSGIWVVSKLWQ